MLNDPTCMSVIILDRLSCKFNDIVSETHKLIIVPYRICHYILYLCAQDDSDDFTVLIGV